MNINIIYILNSVLKKIIICLPNFNIIITKKNYNAEYSYMMTNYLYIYYIYTRIIIIKYIL